MITPITSKLIESGITGIIVAALLIWISRLQDRIDKTQDALHQSKTEHAKLVNELETKHRKELNREHDERLEDQKEFTKTAIELHSSIHKTIAKLAEILEYMKTRKPSIHDE